MMRVLWVQDLDPMVHMGGAQETDKLHIREAVRRGYDVSIMLPQNASTTLIDSADLVVVSNSVSFPQQILGYIVEKKPYVVFAHDYMTLGCRWRGFFPLLERCMGCMYSVFWRRMMNSSKLNLFLSPLQAKMHFSCFPELEMKPYVCVPSPVDVDAFKKADDVVREPHLMVHLGWFTRYKGTQNVLAYAEQHPEYEYHFIGDGDGDLKAEITKRGYKLFGLMPHEALPRVLSKYSRLIHLPANPLPFERVVGESRCVGLGIIGNSNVGALSYEWFRKGSVEEVRKHLSESPKLFWSTIEKEIEI